MLIIATLLHDCALHLTEDSFIALVTGKTKHSGVKEFDTKSWPELWNDFLFSAMRYDDRTIEAIFGQSVPMRRPPLNPGEMTQQDRKLIGEFIRRHHGRLAHEIALFGVPGPTDQPLRLSPELNPRLLDLAGLLARSHSLPLRDTFTYLDQKFDRHVYQRVHAVYLMTLLRIADYLQIQADRAPKQMLQVKNIRSPLSMQEWDAHLAVTNIHSNHLDREAIVIQAEPQDVKTYLRLKDWLAGIQAELDTSWAVLGEVYTPVGLGYLGLVIRRVRSNLDNEEAYAKQAAFVPKRIEFDIARAETLKLLIRPLYGDRPEIGIRELVQNAVDAVRELWDLQEQRAELRNPPLIEQEADVEVWLDDPDSDGLVWLTVTDRGVGMTEEVIRDYFLKAGASYRYSDAWAKQHEEVDEQGSVGGRKSRVLRTGRFGVGVLAAFLLGDYLEVSTRHVTSSTGISFTTTLAPGPIELRHDATLRVGTQVRVRIDQATYNQLTRWESPRHWDWYCLEKPSVRRLLGTDRKQLAQRYTIPGADDVLPKGWHTLADEQFRAVHWSLNVPHAVACNGIRIWPTVQERFGTVSYGGTTPLKLNNHSNYPVDPLDGDTLRLNLPFLSIFDPDGNLPLDLTRTDLTMMDRDLVWKVLIARLDYLLAYLLVKTPTKLNKWSSVDVPDFLSDDWQSAWGFAKSGRAADDTLWPWFYTEYGLSILEAGNIRDAAIETALLFVVNGKRSQTFLAPHCHYDGLFFVSTSTPDAPFSYMSLIRKLMEGGFDNLLPYYPIFIGNSRPEYLSGTRVAISGPELDHIIQELAYETHNQKPEVRHDWGDKPWILYTSGECPPSNLNPEILNSLPVLDATHLRIAAEWYFSGKDTGASILTQRWREIIREPVIPYDLEERRTKLAYAYERLAEYLGDFEPGHDEAGKKSKKKRKAHS
jgi:hypothetical protein